MGMDSLMAVQFRKRIEARLGRRLSSTLTFDYPTIEAIAEYLDRETLSSGHTTPSSPSAMEHEAVEQAGLAGLESLPQEQVKTLLDQELGVVDALMKRSRNGG